MLTACAAFSALDTPLSGRAALRDGWEQQLKMPKPRAKEPLGFATAEVVYDTLRAAGRAYEFQERLDAKLTDKRFSREGAYAATIAEYRAELFPPPPPAPIKSQFDKPPGERRVTALEIIEWLYDNIGVADVEVTDAPTAGAWNHLLTLRANPTMLEDFYKNTWPRILPNKARITEEVAQTRETPADDALSKRLSQLIEGKASDG